MARKRTQLPLKFFARDTHEVARNLLGKIIEVRDPLGEIRVRIIETESYTDNDPACHASRGLTPRNAPMFGPAGRTYVYFIYGMYQMLNFVTEARGKPGAVLIRAGEVLDGHEVIGRRRSGCRPRDWVNGPGKLTQALGIGAQDNDLRLGRPGRICVLDDQVRPEAIFTGPRVGISQGRDRYWRFMVGGHAGISVAKENLLIRGKRIKTGEAIWR